MVADRTGGAERELGPEIEIGLNGGLHLQRVCDVETKVEIGYRKCVGGVLITIRTCWVLGDQCIRCTRLGFENAELDIPIAIVEKGDVVVEFPGSNRAGTLSAIGIKADHLRSTAGIGIKKERNATI